MKTIAAILVLVFALPVSAQIKTTLTIECNNANYSISSYCTAPVDYFVVEDNGEVWGHLVNGVQFTQTNVANDVTRLQRFQLQQAFWYVSDKGAFFAQSDLQALSIYLAK